MAETSNEELVREIEHVLREYENAWDSQDASRCIELWDQDDDEPFYLAEEQDDWRIGWDAVKQYWAPGGPRVVEAMRMRFDSVRARMLAPDLAFAAFWIRFDAKFTFNPKPMGNDTRASAVLRKKPEGWRLVAWTEAPQSPVVYVQKLYELNVKPGFDEFRKDLKR